MDTDKITEIQNKLTEQGHEIDGWTIANKLVRVDDLLYHLNSGKHVRLEAEITLTERTSHITDRSVFSVRQYVFNYISINENFVNFLWEKIHIALQCKKKGIPIPKDDRIECFSEGCSEDHLLEFIWDLISRIELLIYNKETLPGKISFAYTGKWI